MRCEACWLVGCLGVGRGRWKRCRKGASWRRDATTRDSWTACSKIFGTRRGRTLAEEPVRCRRPMHLPYTVTLDLCSAHRMVGQPLMCVLQNWPSQCHHGRPTRSENRDRKEQEGDAFSIRSEDILGTPYQYYVTMLAVYGELAAETNGSARRRNGCLNAAGQHCRGRQWRSS
jgi:hypothetical protein